jgi:DNA-binding winged helix-turn-helix (wHTH) protein
MLSDELPVIRFGVFEVDRQSGELRKQGVKVRLRDQAFQVLLLLLERPAEVITREELQRRLWPADTFVDFDRGLNKAVNRLRETLGDSAESPRFIETLPKRGYRFIASVETGPPRRQPGPPAVSPAASAEVVEPVLPPPVPARLRGWWIVGAAVLVTIAAASYRVLPRQSRTAADPVRVVLADFDNRTGDAAFDDTLKQALTIDLEQSPAVRIVSDAEVTRTLRLMQRAPDERLTVAVARDVCRRVTGHAVLSGSVAILNSEYVLGLNAIDCESGEAVAREQMRTSRKEDVLAAVDAAAVDLRRKLGESTASIQHFDKHVHDMLTTPSLDAFQAYTSGERNVLTKGGWSAIGFFQRAIDLDPDFAYAHAAIGLVLGNMGDATRSRMHTERAYELRDRVSEWERFLITAQYYKRVTGEIEKIPPLCDLWIQAYPRDRTAHRLMVSAYSGSASIRVHSSRLSRLAGWRGSPARCRCVGDDGDAAGPCAGGHHRRETSNRPGAGSSAFSTVLLSPELSRRRREGDGSAGGVGDAHAGGRRAVCRSVEHRRVFRPGRESGRVAAARSGGGWTQ